MSWQDRDRSRINKSTQETVHHVIESHYRIKAYLDKVDKPGRMTDILISDRFNIDITE
jgi:hypothetical protein